MLHLKINNCFEDRLVGQFLASTGQGSKAASPPPLPLVCQVSFVPHQHDDDIASSLCPNIINPLGGLLERIQVCREESKRVLRMKLLFGQEECYAYTQVLLQIPPHHIYI